MIVIGCGKRIFESKTSARKDARNTRGRLGRRLRPYKCPRCGYWHLTKQRAGVASP